MVTWTVSQAHPDESVSSERSRAYSAPAYPAQYNENTGYAAQKDSGFNLIKTILKFDIAVAGFIAIIASIVFGPILGTIFFDIIELITSIF